MTPLLANAAFPAPTSIEIAGWLACLVAVCMGANQVITFFRTVKGHPPVEQLSADSKGLAYRVSSLEEGFKTLRSEAKSDVMHYHEQGEERRRAIYSKMDQFKTELHNEMVNIRTDIKHDFEGVHCRITELLEKFAELKGAFEQTNRQ